MEKKWPFWTNLNNIVNNFNGLILCIDDFNSILCQNENIGGKHFASSSNQNGFTLFLENNGLVDLGFHGLNSRGLTIGKDSIT